MQRSDSDFRVTHEEYDAVLFDLDGVTTDSAMLHATCWKRMFDEFLRERAANTGEATYPSDIDTGVRVQLRISMI
jgi:beta-phosphoglucomutase-like phosphatase (HAD superfamily)